MTETRTLDIENTADATTKISDIKVSGNPDMWVLLCKASSKAQGFAKSTKALAIPGWGVVLHVSTWDHGRLVETLTPLPGVAIGTDGENRPTLVRAKVVPASQSEI